MVRFDAYTATTREASEDDLLQLLADVGGLGAMHRVKQGRGFHTFGKRVSVADESGTEWGAIQWGGRQGEWRMLEVKGERTPKAADALRARFWHRVTRVDACADFDAPGAFERLQRACQGVKRRHRIWGEKRGDWEDQPEKGRTYYLGATSSTTRARLYEKGLQPELAHLAMPDLVRLEVQVRPAKDAKEAYNSLSPLEVWGASAWSRELAGKVLEAHVDPHPAGTVYKLSERETALRWMCKQYGAHLVGLAQDVGSWECVGMTLREMVKEARDA